MTDNVSNSGWIVHDKPLTRRLAHRRGAHKVYGATMDGVKLAAV